MRVLNAAAAWATVPSAVTSSRLLATLTLKPLPARYDSTAWACAPVGAYDETNCAVDNVLPTRIADCSAETSRRRNGTASRRGVDGGAAPKRVASRSETARVAVAAQLEAAPAGLELMLTNGPASAIAIADPTTNANRLICTHPPFGRAPSRKDGYPRTTD